MDADWFPSSLNLVFNVEAAEGKPSCPLPNESPPDAYAGKIPLVLPWDLEQESAATNSISKMDPIQSMTNGLPYFASSPVCQSYRLRAQNLVRQYNSLPTEDGDHRTRILKDLLGSTGDPIWIEAPFRCDYGFNIHVGSGFYANYNLIILDEAPVHIGTNVFIGPSVEIYTANHPLDPSMRETGLENARGVKIGDRTWIGGRAVLVPGVRIGKCCVIGAGSVVTRDIPDFSIAVGNPARVIKTIPHDGNELGLSETIKGREFFRDCMIRAGLMSPELEVSTTNDSGVGSTTTSTI